MLSAQPVLTTTRTVSRSGSVRRFSPEQTLDVTTTYVLPGGMSKVCS